jgi:hypothetical protein
MYPLATTRGSDVRLTLTLTNAAAPYAPVDLTGRSVAIIDVAPLLQGRLTAQVTNAALGQMELFIEGTNPLPRGNYTFTLQILSGGGDSLGIPEITLVVT